MKYEFNASGNQFAVFSEVYYPHGWKAYIDGKETPYCKTNYALRGLAIPAGKHTIDFIFDPEIGEERRTDSPVYQYHICTGCVALPVYGMEEPQQVSENKKADHTSCRTTGTISSLNHTMRWQR